MRLNISNRNGMPRENSGTSVISRYLNERASFVYDISIEEIVLEVSLVFDIWKDLLYSNTRNRRGR